MNRKKKRRGAARAVRNSLVPHREVACNNAKGIPPVRRGKKLRLKMKEILLNRLKSIKLIRKRRLLWILRLAKRISPQFGLLLFAAFTTGLRVRELINLTWADVSPGCESVVVRGQMNGRNRICFIPKVLWKRLPRKNKKNGPVFLDPSGKRWRIARLMLCMKKLNNLPGGDIRFHDLRKAYVSNNIHA